jgi:trigger factor
MSVTVEKKDNNMAVLTIEVPAEKFVEAIEKAYQRQKKSIVIPGFRKGKAPRRMIQKLYGAQVFFEEAANLIFQTTYSDAAKESGEKIVSSPQIDIKQIEEGKPFIYTATVALRPEVTLGQYKGVEIPKKEVTVSEEEIMADIDREREQNARDLDVDDRPVKDKDRIKLDFDGTVDGERFDGGKAEDFDLTIGSGSFIPGFEDQIIGKNIGKEFDVNVTFPEDYHAEALKGKPAVFRCKVNSISEHQVPELDDDFVQDVSEFDTVEEYKADVEKKIRERKEKALKSENESAAVRAALKNASMDIPDAMVEEQAQTLVNEFAQRIQSQGMNMQQYMQITGMNEQTLAQQMKPQALERIQNSLLLEAVAKAENVEISDERLDEEVEKMAEAYNMEKEKLYDLMGEESRAQMKQDLAIQEAVKIIAENAVEVEMPEEESVDLEENPEEN